MGEEDCMPDKWKGIIMVQVAKRVVEKHKTKDIGKGTSFIHECLINAFRKHLKTKQKV